MFRNIRRYPSRVRKVQGRERVKPFSGMTPEGEAMYCEKVLKLGNKVASPMKVKRSMYD